MPTFPPVLILAGGLGTRISQVAGGLPKSLVPVLGKPFIDRQLELLQRQGVERVVLCIGHKGDLLSTHVGDGSRYRLRVDYSADGEELCGTGAAVVRASRLLSGPFAVLYGDSYLDVPFAPVHQRFLAAEKPGLMTVYRNENALIPSNVLLVDGDIAAYDKSLKTQHMQHVDFGLSLFLPSAFAGFEGRQHFDLGEVFQRLIASGQLAGYETNQRFYEIGTPEGLRDLEEHLLRTQQHI